jgi:predicted transposase/invertase (TIGR01784 family)
MAAKTKKSKSKDRQIISLDYAIKSILREKSNFGVLSGFLTELMGRDVAVQEVLESESNKDEAALKTTRVDLKAKIGDGEIAIFEIQFATQVDFFGKMIFDVSKAIVEQIPEGGKYDIKKVYMIGIAYFNPGARHDYLFTAKVAGFKGIHSDEIIPFSQTYGLTPPDNPKKDIHPEYYLILPNKFDEQIRNRFDEWVYTLKTSIVKAEFKAAGLKEAGIKLDRLNMTPEERRVYDKFVRDRTDDNTIIETAWMEGEESGVKKGRKEGLAKGRAEGLKEGMAEGEAKEKRKTAHALKSKGFDAKTIAEITGLSIQEVESL